MLISIESKEPLDSDKMFIEVENPEPGLDVMSYFWSGLPVEIAFVLYLFSIFLVMFWNGATILSGLFVVLLIFFLFCSDSGFYTCF